MSTLATNFNSSLFSGFDVPLAGSYSKETRKRTVYALKALKVENRSESSFAFNDLRSLAAENQIDYQKNSTFLLAHSFLLSLPTHLPKPELALENDGEISFDWIGADNKMFSVSLREDGRLSYAVRISSTDKDYGTKIFIDEIPKQVIEYIQKVTRN